MFSCKFCEISKNTFFTEHFGATASEGLNEDSSSGWILSEAATEGVLLKKGALENFANFIGKHLYRNLFLIKLQAISPATSLKRDSNTNVLLWKM